MSEAVARVSPAVPPARSVHITPRPSPPADEEEGPGAPARSPTRPRHAKPARQGLQPPRRSPGSCGFSPRIWLPLKQIAWHRRGEGPRSWRGVTRRPPSPARAGGGGPRTPPRAAHAHDGPPVQTSLHARGCLPCTPAAVPVHTLAPLHNSPAPCTPQPPHTHRGSLAHPHPRAPMHTRAHTGTLSHPCPLAHTPQPLAHSCTLVHTQASPHASPALLHTHTHRVAPSHTRTAPHSSMLPHPVHVGTVAPWTR